MKDVFSVYALLEFDKKPIVNNFDFVLD